MAQRKSRLDDLEDVEIDMTPMIDVVFNLIIFFMLVNQMVQVERAQIELPDANQAVEEKVQDPHRLIINVYKDNSIEISGRKVPWKEMAEILYKESRLYKNSEGLPDLSVLIRGDILTPYETIQKVMVECANQRIYKISFGAKVTEE